MSDAAWDAKVERFTERLNPIIVKEVRQGLRTKIFWICFGLMLLACFVISLIAWGSSLEGGFREAGQTFFFAYFFCLSVVHFFIIPYSAYRSLAREREEETWVLLSLTGIGSRRIIRGKVGSFLAQALLYGSAVLPFLLFSYYLNGISLPAILAVVALGGAFMVFLTCSSVCAATLAESRLLRGLVHFGVLGVLLAGTGAGLAIAGAMTFDSGRIFRDQEFWYAVGAALWAMVSYGFLLYQSAAARLALPTEDYARGPRLAALLQAVGTLAIGLGIWLFEGRDPDIPLAGQALLMANLFAVSVFLFAGSDAVHEVHYARGGSLLRPGTVRALRFTVFVAGVTTAAGVVAYAASTGLRSDAERGLYFLLAAPAYVLIYLTLPIVIARLTGVWSLNTPAGLRVFTLTLLVGGSGIPPLVGLILGIRPEDPVLNVFNPLVGPVNLVESRRGTEHEVLLGVVLAAALLLTVVTDRLLSSREQSLRALRGSQLPAPTP